jgi:hypothetical protein
MPKDPDRVAILLEPTSTSSERVNGLLAAGLSEEHIAMACRVSLRVVGKWKLNKSGPRATQFRRLDDLRTLCLFAIQVSGYDLKLATGLLLRLKAPALVAEERFSEAHQALLTLEQRRRQKLAAQT